MSLPPVLTDSEIKFATDTITAALRRAGVKDGVVLEMLTRMFAARVFRDERSELAIRVEHPACDLRREMISERMIDVTNEWIRAKQVAMPLADGMALILSKKSPEAELERRRDVVREEERQREIASHASRLADAAAKVAAERENQRRVAWMSLTPSRRAAVRLGDGTFTAMQYADALDAESGITQPPAGWIAPANPIVQPATSSHRAPTFAPARPPVFKPAVMPSLEGKVTTEREVIRTRDFQK